MTKFLNTIGKVAIGVAIGGMVTAGGFLIYEYAVKDKDSNEIPNFNFNWEEERFDNSFDLKLKEGTSKTSVPYLGSAGLVKLKALMKSQLGFGPEIAGLKSINIVEGGYISGGDYGVFIDSTKQIFLNVNTLKNVVPYTGVLEDKVNLCLQIIYHEYGHYIASSYLKNIKPGTTPAVSLRSWNNNLHNDFLWNKYFLDNFKNTLNYNQTTHSTNGHWSDGTINLGSVYSLKELFDITNGTASPSYGKLTNKTVIGGEHSAIGSRRCVTSSKLEYMYSMDELYTRKYQQIGMVMTTTKAQGGGMENGWYTAPGSSGATVSPMLIDTLNYQFDSDARFYRTKRWDVKDFTFMNDGPYYYDNHWVNHNERAKALYDLMLDEFGQSRGDDISYITSKNDAKMIDDENFIYNDENGVYPNLIKFGGYVSDNRYHFVGWYDDPTRKIGFHPISEIYVHDFDYSYKSALDSKTLIKPTGEKMFYVTKEWKDVNGFKNRKLFFSTDNAGTSSHPLSSVKSGKYGLANNYFSEAPQPFVKGNTYYYADLDGGIATIKGGRWD